MEKEKLVKILSGFQVYSAVVWALTMLGLSFAIGVMDKAELLVLIPIAGFMSQFTLISSFISKIKQGKEVRFKDLL